MSKSLIARDGLAIEGWDNVVNASPDGLLFHLSDWLDVLAAVQNLKLKRYGLYAESGELIGVSPVFFKQFGILKTGGSPIIVEDTPYLGPTVSGPVLAEAINAVQVAVRKEKASFLRILHHTMPDETTRGRLADRGFTCISKHTHRLDLIQGLDSIWNKMDPKCRTSIRRAEKSGVSVVIIEDMADGLIALESYYSFVKTVYNAQRMVPPNPIELFTELWKRFHPRAMLSLYMAKVAGRDIAGILLGHHKGRVYYLDGARNSAFAKLPATNLLLWKAIQWSYYNRYKEFDFVGSDIPRLAKFKASFGGELVPHLCAEWSKSSLISFLRQGYGSYGKQVLQRIKLVASGNE